MAAAIRRSGRDPGCVRLLAVTKRVSAGQIQEAVAAGIDTLGENYVQEACGKQEMLRDSSLEWHLIGHLQTNKAKLARSHFTMVQTVDRIEVARALSRSLARHGTEEAAPLQVLAQVYLGGGDQRSGIAPEGLPPLLEELAGMEGLALRGLMGVPPPEEKAEETRRHFAYLRTLWEAGRQQLGDRVRWDTLSMGMSGDFEIAIEEGTTLVRVGTAIFGARDG